jgi:hypothetical protein
LAKEAALEEEEEEEKKEEEEERVYWTLSADYVTATG